MPSLDTNVLVRYIVHDDSTQFSAAARLIRRCVDDNLSLFVPVTVLLELEWVLRSSFGYAKDAVLHAMACLLSASELTFESERAVETALQLFRESAADFAHCLHIALSSQAGEQPLWTFDKGAAKVAGARLLTR